MRWTLLGVLAAAVLASCGGSDYSPGQTETASAALEGVIYEVDGQTGDRSGVQVVVVETGQSVTTGSDGSFAFDLPPGDYTLDFDAVLPKPRRQEAGGEEDETGAEDSEERPRCRVRLGCARILLRLALRDGKVTELSLEDIEIRYARARLESLVDGYFGKVVLASITPAEEEEVDAGAGGEEGETAAQEASPLETELFKIFAFGFQEGDEVVFLLEDEELATVTADEFGRAYVRYSTADDKPLPGDAETAADLAGLGVQVLLKVFDGEEQEGTSTVLQGYVPDLPAEPNGPCHRFRGRRPFAPFLRGKARLDIQVEEELFAGLCIKSMGKRQLFSMFLKGLEPDTEVVFEILDPDTGEWVELGTDTANERGCAGIVLPDPKQEDSELPLGVADVKELADLEIRILRGGVVIATGRVPSLVRD